MTKYDLISLGEIMLRFDPGDSRVRTARSFNVWEGGGEYNVARALSSCFGLNTAVITAFADNDIGRLAENLIRTGGVDTSLIKWMPYDGIGSSVRNGLNFVERGYGLRGSKGTSDRGNTAISKLKPADIDFDYIFGTLGTRYFHTGGIYAALSDIAPETALAAVSAAKKYNTTVSFDMNYRPSLWAALEDTDKEIEYLRRIAGSVDILFAGDIDLTVRLGVEKPNCDAGTDEFITRLCDNTIKKYPNIKYIAMTKRRVISASKNDWTAVLYHNGKIIHGRKFENIDVLDRIGSGDAFASGIIYGLMKYDNLQKTLDCGIIHGALAMTTPGDVSMATLGDIESLLGGADSAVIR